MMGVLCGKWIVCAAWMSACMENGSSVPEEPYEVQKDCHGCEGGPILGRLYAAEHTRLLTGFEVCSCSFVTAAQLLSISHAP